MECTGTCASSSRRRNGPPSENTITSTSCPSCLSWRATPTTCVSAPPSSRVPMVRAMRSGSDVNRDACPAAEQELVAAEPTPARRQLFEREAAVVEEVEDLLRSGHL